MRALIFVVFVLLSGCLFQNASAQARLQEAVYELNDHARWGRSHAALEKVDPRYRGRFAERREVWGEKVQIADVEVQHLKLSEDEESADSIVSVSWYSLKDMNLRNTVISQKWRKGDRGFLLASENVIDGDKLLLAN